jgi:hypothetical protein
MDRQTLARWRMHTLRLAGEPYRSVPDVVRGLLGVQAEMPPQACWAVATRTPGTTEAAVLNLLDDGVVLRTHVLRSTWHFVTPDDIAWLLELTAPGVRPAYRSSQSSLGLSADELERSVGVVVDALDQVESLSRGELAERLAEAGLRMQGQRLGLVLATAELEGLVCSGRGGPDRYALLSRRAPAARRLARDEALAEIALRYVTGHGPVTERDLSYWATLTLGDVRRGLAAAGDRLRRTEVDGRAYWYADEPPDGVARLEPRAHLLQMLDEAYRGYQDSRDLIDLAGIVPSGRPPDVGMVLIDGQMVGGLRRSVREDEVRFDLRLHRALDRGELRAVHDAAERYGTFLGRRAVVQL